MPEAAKPAASKPASERTEHANSTHPEPAAMAAAAAPCGCGERVELLETRVHVLELMSRAVGWMSVAVAFAVVYLLWSGPAQAKEPAAK